MNRRQAKKKLMNEKGFVPKYVYKTIDEIIKELKNVFHRIRTMLDEDFEKHLSNTNDEATKEIVLKIRNKGKHQVISNENKHCDECTNTECRNKKGGELENG